MSAQILAMNNVELSPDMTDNLKGATAGVHPLLAPVISRLATLYPLWRLVAVRARHMATGLGIQPLAVDFKVYHEGEELGTIELSRRGGDDVIAVGNERIDRARARSRAYRTMDADKAILMAKKMFSKKNVNERVKTSEYLAEKVLTKGVWQREREINKRENEVEGAAFSFIKGVGYKFFLEYLEKEEVPSARDKLKKIMEEIVTYQADMVTIKKVQENYDKEITALVIRDGGSYIVKQGDQLNNYDDTTLPEAMRMKLGMLKLVGDEHYVADVGCRVSNEVFVLLMD